MLGVEVEVGDVIVSASGTGRHKVGKVYGFVSGNGLALIHSLGDVYNRKEGKYEPKWTKVSSGYSVLVIGREVLGVMQPTDETWRAIQREYPGDSPNVG
jgi:hypothetical protein